jgi:CubicO group peptidase (beta-lactamase class C family)
MKFVLLSLLLAAPVVMAAADLDEIRALLANRVDQSKKAVGMVVGVIDANGQKIVAHGKMALDRGQTPDGDTVFEIGSLTKVFTSLVLADMIERGEVKADDPVSKFLPADVKVPSRNGRQITLLDLSMQLSGLPRLPDNLAPADPMNPYADYTPARLYDFLGHYTLTRDSGEKYEYSNPGAGLLGFALARKAGMSYEELVLRRILEPLGMNSTSITLSADQKKRLAAGYNAGLEPVANWDFDALAGCGALRSTVHDLLKFAAANLGLIDTPLAAAMRRMRSVHHETGVADLDILMGWHEWHKYGTDIVWHNGGTYGYRSFAGLDLAKKSAVVILCNTFFDVDDLGLHVLESRWPAATLPPARQEITVAPEVLQSYVGQYQFAPGVVLTVTLAGTQLSAQLTGQPAFPVYASTPTEFFLKVVEAGLTFEKDASDAVAAVVLHQGGRDQRAARLKPGN